VSESGQLALFLLKLTLLILELPLEEFVVPDETDFLLPELGLLLAGDRVTRLIQRFLLQMLKIILVLAQLVLQVLEIHLYLLLESDVAPDGGL